MLPQRISKTVALAALALALQLACVQDPGSGTYLIDSGSDAGDTAADDADSALTDTGSDAGPDSADLGGDTAADSGGDGAVTDTGDDANADAGDDVSAPDQSDDASAATFFDCTDRAFTFTPEGDWESALTLAIAWQDSGHSVEDMIATRPFTTWEVEGKFAYGPLGNDLQDEWVDAFIDTCSGWQPLGRALTDSDGRARFEVHSNLLPGPGRYAVRMAVEVDGSEARGYLLAVPADTQFVVFDIDGTLTTSDSELIADFVADLFGGDFVPEAYEGAHDVVNAYADAGYEILYLTGRPYWVDGITRDWLELEEFPVGTLHLTRTLSESLPTEGGVGTYKRDWLAGVMANHTVLRAYGNADTDIYAYHEAGVPVADTYIIGDLAGQDGTQPIDNYPDHLDAVTIPAAEQPWE